MKNLILRVTLGFLQRSNNFEKNEDIKNILNLLGLKMIDLSLALILKV